MKTKSIFAAMVALCLLAGCNKEDNPNGPVPDGTKTYAAFTVKVNTMGVTRADGDGNAVEAEQKIARLDLFIFSGGVLETTGSVTLDNNNTGTTTLQTTTGTKDIFAVANPTGEMTAAVGSTQKAFEEKVIATTSGDNSTIAVENKFVMVGKKGDAVITQQDEAGAKSNPVAITVTRATAKVQMKYKDVPVAEKVAATFGDPRFTLAQGNTKMFIYRADGAVTPSGNSADQADVNPKDGTYDHLTPLKDSYADGDFKTANTDYDNSFTGSCYTAENVNQAPNTGNSTFVMIRLKCTPTTVESGTALTDGTFFMAVKYKTNAHKVVDSYEYKYFASKSDADSWITTNHGGDDTWASAEYTNGYCYYRLNIRDIRETDVPKRYSVLRNNYYKVNITQIDDMGSNTPGGLVPEDPETPLETSTHISASITIEAWTTVDMNEPLG